MFWLIQSHSSSTRQSEAGDDSPRRFLDLGEVNFFLQRFHCRLQVVAHEIERRTGMPVLGFCWRRAVRGMHGQFARRERENRPAAAGVNRSKPQRVTQKRTIRFCLLAVKEKVRAEDHELFPYSQQPVIPRSLSDQVVSSG